MFNDEHEGYTFFAHNAKSFDAQFILKYCVDNTIKPFCIYNGTKIMFMAIEKYDIRFIDSINFVNGALETFPKTFGLTELKKGYFPHLFNIPANQDYVGPIPAKHYYDPDHMNPEKRSKFLKWYNERVAENYVFNFKNELVAYCRSDVDILRRSAITFRDNFLKIGNIDPLQYITIASVCIAIYRSKYMPEKTIGVIKDGMKNETLSKISIQWLNWQSSVDNVYIQHAMNGGEHFIPRVGKVDGFCKTTNTVYEFQGCFWHGCTKCYTADKINPMNQKDMAELQRATAVKNEKITSLGYNLVEVYECDIQKDTAFKKYYKTNDFEVVVPLNPRDAFFGGRTNVTKLTYDFKPGEKGRYVDFVSLYPTVNLFKTYPVGHPTKIYNPRQYDPKWFGFVQAKVEPPRGLYHPVLPARIKCRQSEKLLFSLCRTCSSVQQQTKCEHSSDERTFTGTWCTNEIALALGKGYRIIEIYEVWHFSKTTDTLFKGYVRDFMKIKMESSEPPKEDMGVFKKKVQDHLGIELGDIQYNAGMRAIAKLCLNSLWGKFGQRVNQTQTEYVTKPKNFYKILLNDANEDINIQFLTKEMVQMQFNLKNQFVDNYNNTNIFVAAFTTSHAREMLYGVLDKLGDQVLGYDTDSCWFVERPGGGTIPTGDSLGELTDELNGHHIVKWVGTGPKSYSYETNDGNIKCKVKGFTLNYANGLKLNGNVMDEIIHDPNKTVVIAKKNAITRDAQTKMIVNQDQTKTFSLGYDKRVVQHDFDTLPYGFQKKNNFK